MIGIEPVLAGRPLKAANQVFDLLRKNRPIVAFRSWFDTHQYRTAVPTSNSHAEKLHSRYRISLHALLFDEWA